MAKKKSSEPFVLKVIPGGPFDQFKKSRDPKIPKDSNQYLHDMIGIYGVEKVENMVEVGIGDYVYNKGIIHAMNMNVGRSIPWMEDGLKSVERRVIYTMWKYGYYKNSSAKVSKVVGDMISLLYPHGDQAPADTIYRLGRPKTMMLPYIQELGNYGNMKDLRPAASRYARAALTDYAFDCFFGDVGPKRPLYDEKDTYEYTNKEPIYLVSRYPNILMQWNLGIGKGAMSWLGAFNSQDIFKATLALMDDPHAKIDIYPDTPVEMDIVNKSELKGCFDKSKFKVKLQAPYYVEVDKRRNGTKIEDKYTIVFTSLPISVTGDQIRNEIDAIKEEDKKRTNKRLPEVINIECNVDEDTAGPGGIHLIIEYEHGYDPAVLAEKLYKSTSLSKTVGVLYKLIIDNQPVTKTPREILLAWISQRYDQKRRFYHQLVLRAAKDRAIYDALTTVLATKDATDKAINLIRSSTDDATTAAKLCKEFGFTEFQAHCVMEIRLKTLAKMNIEEVIRARDAAIHDYKHYRKLLGDDDAVKEAVREELKRGLEKYAKPRNAKLRNSKKGNVLGEAGEAKYILYNKDYYFCFDDPKSAGEVWTKVDNTYRLTRVKNSDNVLIFDQKGISKLLNGYAFSMSDSGISMSTLGMSDVVSILPDLQDSGYKSLVLVTEQGYGKVMEMSEAMKAVKGRAINLNSGDKLAAVVAVKANSHPNSIVGMVQGDKMYYLKVSDFPVYKRSSAGNRMIKGVSDLCLSNAIYFDASENPDYMLIYGESGYLKLLDAAFLPFSKRGINMVSLQGKKIIGAVLLHGSEDDVELFGGVINGKTNVRLQIGKTVKFTTESGEEQRFKMSTSIGSPVKVLKVSKNEWYALV